MSTLNLETNSLTIPYHSLASLKEVHTDFLKRHKEGETEELLSEIEIFIRRGSATGALLADENDRYASQSLLDYWMTVLYRAKRIPPDATLAEFDPSLSPKLDDSLCPYRGLNAFQEDDQENFFGRQRVIKQIVEKIRETRLLFVVGPSGSGKSSLVLAGLVPALKNDILEGSKRWQYFPPIVPGRNPVKNLVISLNKIYNQPQKWVKWQIEQLKHDPSHLLKIIGEFGNEPAVLIVDQFEEVFTLSTNDELRDAFINNLISLSESAGPPHIIILTLRTDFETRVAQHPALMSLFADEKRQLWITPLSATDLREAIEGPAKPIGLKFESGVVDKLINDILGEPEGLPLLQFTLLRLWKMREDGRSRITLRQYNKLGNARQALASTADEFYDSLPEDKKKTVEKILLRLALTRDENEEVLRNPVKREELHFAAPYRIDQVLDNLYKAGLVRITKGDTEATDRIEVAHEALVRNWPKLIEWIENARVSRRQRRRLTMAAQQWLDHNKDEGGLLGGSVLAEALQYDDFNDLEKEFVQASKAAVERAEKEKEEARLREQELERAKVQALKQKNTEIAEKAKKLRRLVKICVVLTLFSIGMTFVASYYLRSYKGISESEKQMDKLRNKADSKFEKHQMDEAKEDYENLLSKSIDANDRLRQGYALSQLSRYYKTLGDKHLSDSKYEEAQKIFQTNLEESRDDKNKFEAAFLELFQFYKDHIDPEKADETLRELIKQAQDQNSHLNLSGVLVESLQNLGDFYKNSGNSKEAEEYYRQALEHQKKRQDFDKQDNETQDSETLATLYYKVGDLRQNQGDYEQAKENYENVIRIYKSNINNNEDMLARSHIKLACISYISSTKDHSGKSEKYHKEAIEHIKEALKNSKVALSRLNEEMHDLLLTTLRVKSFKGEVSAEPKNIYEQLLRLFHEAIKDSDLRNQRQGPTDTIDECIWALDQIYRPQGNYKKLVAFYNQALEIRKKINEREKNEGNDDPSRDDKTRRPDNLSVYGTYRELGHLYRTLKRYKDAEDNYEQAHIIASRKDTDSLTDLAAVYREQGKYSEAKKLLDKVREIRSKQPIAKKKN